jgi:hypothetical protein
MPAKTRTYVRHIVIPSDKHDDIDSLLDQLILEETEGGATVKTITSSMDDGGLVIYTIMFERIVMKKY